jgi:hypothetical protein
LALHQERHNTSHKSPGGGQEQASLLPQTPPLPPSYLSGGNHQENTRIPQPKITQMPLRCKLTITMHLDHSFSLWISNQARKMSGEGVCLAQEDVKIIKSSREAPKSRPPTIYKPPQRIELLCLRWGLT